MMTLFVYLKVGAVLVPFGTFGTFPPALCLEERAKIEKEFGELASRHVLSDEKFVVTCEVVPPEEKT